MINTFSTYDWSKRIINHSMMNHCNSETLAIFLSTTSQSNKQSMFSKSISVFLISDFYVEDEGSGNPLPTTMPPTTLPSTDSPAKERVKQFFYKHSFMQFLTTFIMGEFVTISRRVTTGDIIILVLGSKKYVLQTYSWHHW